VADAAQIRAVLRENGIDVPERGNLSAQHRAEYERLTGADAGDSPGEPPMDDGGLGVTEADFGPDPEPVAAEVVPTRPRGQRGGKHPRWDRLRGGPPPKSPGRGKATRAVKKRVSLDRLATRTWEIAGRIVSQVDVPLGRVIVWQSDSAGLMVEELFRGTFVDRVIQPLARAEARAEIGFALIGPGLCVAGLRAADGLPEQQRAMRQAIILPILRESIVINLQIAGTLAEQRIEEGIDLTPFYAKADEVLAAVFAPPPGQPVPEPAPEMAPA
jgi:hypothetical protein